MFKTLLRGDHFIKPLAVNYQSLQTTCTAVTKRVEKISVNHDHSPFALKQRSSTPLHCICVEQLEFVVSQEKHFRLLTDWVPGAETEKNLTGLAKSKQKMHDAIDRCYISITEEAFIYLYLPLTVAVLQLSVLQH